MKKEGSFKVIFIVMAVSLLIAFLWDSMPVIGQVVHSILDPTVGWFLNLNLDIGMLVVVALLTLITTIIQKYTTDQEALRQLKKEQKAIQEEMKKFRDNPQKMMELNKKSFEFLPKTMKLSMRSLAYTAIPFIIFFRWFTDYFTAAGDPKLFGFLGWFLFYLIFTIIFSSIFRKVLKVV